jgi:hypothetical protein
MAVSERTWKVGPAELVFDLLVALLDPVADAVDAHDLGQAGGRVKDTGLRNLPLKGFAQNQLWCEIAALACELLAWTQMLALTGPARRWEPKRLRLRLFSAAGRPVRGGRRLRLRLCARWPWVGQITAAATRLQALPSG